jgi:hypothetical protein
MRILVAAALIVLPACSGAAPESDEATLNTSAIDLEAKANAEVDASINQINADAAKDAPAPEATTNDK